MINIKQYINNLIKVNDIYNYFIKNNGNFCCIVQFIAIASN